MASVRTLLATEPQTTVLWCFNDSMALGAASAAVAAGRRPGKDLLIGGVDLLDRALSAIIDGTMHVSLGGHVVDGVRALLLLAQLAPKVPLAGPIPKTGVEAVTAQDASRYRAFAKDRRWRSADFTRFSARGSRGGAPAELCLRALMEQ
jgi:ABC-type sugar transport system substrate-binding protein